MRALLAVILVATVVPAAAEPPTTEQKQGAGSPAVILAPDDVPALWRISGPPEAKYGRRPRKLSGLLEVAGQMFPFVSGGSGWSIPYGHWPVTPEEVGSWGKRHGAIGLNHGDDIPDPQIGRNRDGVEIHAAESNHTQGCVGIREHYKQLKTAVLGMIEKFGSAWLHVTPAGAAITPWKVAVVVQGEMHGDSADGDEDGSRHQRHHHHERVRVAYHHGKHHHHQRYASR